MRVVGEVKQRLDAPASTSKQNSTTRVNYTADYYYFAGQ